MISTKKFKIIFAASLLTLVGLSFVLCFLPYKRSSKPEPLKLHSDTPAVTFDEKQLSKKTKESLTPTLKSEVDSRNSLVQSKSEVKNESGSPLLPVESKISQGCFTLSYSHKKLAAHEDGEACSKHKNQLSLHFPEQAENAVVNPKSICVQVNGTTVKHQFEPKHPSQVVISSDAGPHARVTVRYCLGESKCNEKCPVVPVLEDKFMSALSSGGEGSGESENGVVTSQSGDSSDESPELEKEMVTLVQKIDELAAESFKHEIFKDWLVEKHTNACRSRQTHTIAHLQDRE